MGKLKSDKTFTVVNYTLLAILTLIILYPLYFTVIASISEPYEVVSGNVVLWPKGFTLESYAQIFHNEEIWTGFRNSTLYTVFGTMMSLILTIPAAYALSKKNLWGRGIITTYFVIIMYFSGGLLPTYLVVRDLGLLNQPYTLVIIGSFSVYNMVVARTYYQSSIPESLYEAAEIDGAGRCQIFFRITLPLLSSVIFYVVMLSLINAFQLFPQVMVMTTNAGPNGATEVMVERIYKYAFRFGKMGYAAAFSWLLFIVIMIFTLFQKLGERRFVSYDN